MERLKELREESKMSQEDLAEKLGVSQQTVSKYEQGKREPDNQTLIDLSKIFDVTTDFLLGKSKERNPVLKVNQGEVLAFHLEEKLEGLPPEAIKEINDHIEWIRAKFKK